MQKLIAQVADIAVAAGEEILAVYAGAFTVETKADGTPLTQADRRAHQLIQRRLREISDYPILSEESAAEEFAARRSWRRFWLVDPLDGTKEFVRRSDEFSVNIALIDGCSPRLGVVHAPVFGRSYFAQADGPAYQQNAGQPASMLRPKPFDARAVMMATSRSHAGVRVAEYRKRLASVAAAVEVMPMGSSLKICAVAAGLADVYPRLGPTSEWDTAAAHCILEAAGGQLTDLDGAPLQYNKRDLRNPWFVAYADAAAPWAELARDLRPPAAADRHGH